MRADGITGLPGELGLQNSSPSSDVTAARSLRSDEIFGLGQAINVSLGNKRKTNEDQEIADVSLYLLIMWIAPRTTSCDFFQVPAMDFATEVRGYSKHKSACWSLSPKGMEYRLLVTGEDNGVGVSARYVRKAVDMSDVSTLRSRVGFPLWNVYISWLGTVSLNDIDTHLFREGKQISDDVGIRDDAQYQVTSRFSVLCFRLTSYISVNVKVRTPMEKFSCSITCVRSRH